MTIGRPSQVRLGLSFFYLGSYSTGLALPTAAAWLMAATSPANALLITLRARLLYHALQPNAKKGGGYEQPTNMDVCFGSNLAARSAALATFPLVNACLQYRCCNGAPYDRQIRPPEYQQLSHASCGQPPPSPYLQKLETREKLPFAGAAKSPARWQSFCCPLPSWLLKP
ncbi:hypothetical protein TEQG_03355 [Trichophyton equinum CBS 127.97]|uniref:Uncharacterized protein n=1 Tax=Trichophyton equinum (strain ATCC MYA-4606 / CBS 127.97) TaxID=559882 RepID=F2PR09_TRIEC|nr:hypothetical protein TEQG_03355 [Trichophyton equinum CBS 127.97]